ncbi:hypothetical protein [Aquimonas sp.]|jgi:hypothetical protein|uniref:hypothetical protein n=1 Tax=Aquimonas sp. TaxID=1872588 RepID=UPI0037C0C2FD
MRPDMQRVLIDCYRGGLRIKSDRSGKPRVQQYPDADSDAGPHRPKRLRTRWFSDNLGPLRRWLRAQVGRPWNSVWSELCAGVDSDTMAGQHLLEHVFWEVERDCRMDGRVALKSVDRSWRDGRVDGLYVHPRTGLLRWQPPLPRPGPQPPQDWRLLPQGDERLLRQVRGLWFALKVEALGRDWQPDAKTRAAADVLALGGQSYRVLGQRQLNHRELRLHGLHNQHD